MNIYNDKISGTYGVTGTAVAWVDISCCNALLIEVWSYK